MKNPKQLNSIRAYQAKKVNQVNQEPLLIKPQPVKDRQQVKLRGLIKQNQCHLHLKQEHPEQMVAIKIKKLKCKTFTRVSCRVIRIRQLMASLFHQNLKPPYKLRAVQDQEQFKAKHQHYSRMMRAKGHKNLLHLVRKILHQTLHKRILNELFLCANNLIVMLYLVRLAL